MSKPYVRFNTLAQARTFIRDVRDNFSKWDRRRFRPKMAAAYARKHPRLKRLLTNRFVTFYPKNMPRPKRYNLVVFEHPKGGIFTYVTRQMATWAEHKGYNVRRRFPPAWRVDTLDQDDPVQIWPVP